MLFFFFCFVLFCLFGFFIDCLLVCVFGCLIFSVKVTGKLNKSYAASRHDICRWLATKKRIATANIHKLIIQCHIFKKVKTKNIWLVSWNNLNCSHLSHA